MKFNTKITNTELENDGAWVTYPMNDVIKIKMIRSTKEEPQKALQKMLQAYKKSMRNEKAKREVVVKWLAKHIVSDWEGIYLDGKPFDFNVDNATTLFSYDDDFYTWVLEESASLINFAEEDEYEYFDETLEERGEELKK